ncbi:MAG: LTA synthase family protein [Oscillospiraceae bacterium]|nr:LTA synthase family protein [Oscillospiraceae bacterium]
MNSALTEYIVLRWRSYLYVIPEFALLFLALFFLFRKFWVPTLILSVISLVFGVATYNNTFYRGSPLSPADLALTRDAVVAVKEGFSIVLPKGFWLSITFIVLLTVLSFLGSSNFKVDNKNLKVLFVFLAILSITFSYLYYIRVLKGEKFLKRISIASAVVTGDVYYKHGFFPSFIAYISALNPSPPPSYSSATMQDIGTSIQSWKTDDEPVDIIIFQVESWQDVSNYDVDLSEDVFANYHALAAEGISGTMVSPKYGGGTANIEYEVLTGFTTSDGMTAELPFNTGLHEGFPGIVNYADSIGYQTISVHAYTSDLYNRPNAYRMLGFQNSYYSDSFDDPEYCGPWISDRECARKMIELYEGALLQDGPILIHGLSMQNHLPIGDDRFPSSELVLLKSSTLSDPDQFVMRCFCTCLKWTDDALGILADYFRTVDRKVILLAYGDHQTSIYADESAGDVLHHTDFYDSYDSTSDFIKLHGTPYPIWANF